MIIAPFHIILRLVSNSKKYRLCIYFSYYIHFIYAFSFPKDTT